MRWFQNIKKETKWKNSNTKLNKIEWNKIKINKNCYFSAEENLTGLLEMTATVWVERPETQQIGNMIVLSHNSKAVVKWFVPGCESHHITCTISQQQKPWCVGTYGLRSKAESPQYRWQCLYWWLQSSCCVDGNLETNKRGFKGKNSGALHGPESAPAAGTVHGAVSSTTCRTGTSFANMRLLWDLSVVSIYLSIYVTPRQQCQGITKSNCIYNL